MHALAVRNETQVLDALADIEYITIGSAITFDLPLTKAFNAVHDANMTKHICSSSVNNQTGDKGKGKDYRPPNIQQVIDKHFAEKNRMSIGLIVALDTISKPPPLHGKFGGNLVKIFEVSGIPETAVYDDGSDAIYHFAIKCWGEPC